MESLGHRVSLDQWVSADPPASLDFQERKDTGVCPEPTDQKVLKVNKDSLVTSGNPDRWE